MLAFAAPIKKMSFALLDGDDIDESYPLPAALKAMPQAIRASIAEGKGVSSKNGKNMEKKGVSSKDGNKNIEKGVSSKDGNKNIEKKDVSSKDANKNIEKKGVSAKDGNKHIEKKGVSSKDGKNIEKKGVSSKNGKKNEKGVSSKDGNKNEKGVSSKDGNKNIEKGVSAKDGNKNIEKGVSSKYVKEKKPLVKKNLKVRSCLSPIPTQASKHPLNKCFHHSGVDWLNCLTLIRSSKVSIACLILQIVIYT